MSGMVLCSHRVCRHLGVQLCNGLRVLEVRLPLLSSLHSCDGEQTRSGIRLPPCGARACGGLQRCLLVTPTKYGSGKARPGGTWFRPCLAGDLLLLLTFFSVGQLWPGGAVAGGLDLDPLGPSREANTRHHLQGGLPGLSSLEGPRQQRLPSLVGWLAGWPGALPCPSPQAALQAQPFPP